MAKDTVSFVILAAGTVADDRCQRLWGGVLRS